MAKTNYTKVDELVDKGLKKMEVEYLLKKTEKASKTPGDGTSLGFDQSHLVTTLQRDFKSLQKKDKEMYAKLGLEKKEMKRMLENPLNLTAEEWQTLQQIHDKLQVFKEELKKTLPNLSDDSIVEAQRQKHINKRYNVNEKWLPLK